MAPPDQPRFPPVLGTLILRDMLDTVRNPLSLPFGAAFCIGMGFFCRRLMAHPDPSVPLSGLLVCLAMTTMWGALVVTINTVVQERSCGTAKILADYGVRPWQIMASKVLTAVALCFALSFVTCLALSLEWCVGLAVAAAAALASIPTALLCLACGLAAHETSETGAPAFLICLMCMAGPLACLWEPLGAVAWMFAPGGIHLAIAHALYGTQLPAAPWAICLVWVAWLGVGALLVRLMGRRLPTLLRPPGPRSA